jgi:prepilin signal peptidase PulO-like enzyme (type II secretory pathway)
MTRRSRWRFVWSEESTKRGLVRLLTAICALLATKYRPELVEVILSLGLLFIGMMGTLRSDE